MRNKIIFKKILIILITLFVSIVVIIATHIISIAYYKNYGQYNGGDAKRVSKVPDRFISIENLYDDTNGNLGWDTVFFPQIVFFDSDGVHIYIEYLDNAAFIVRYKDEYYINEFNYENLVFEADMIAEQRNRIYTIGDAVIVRARGNIPYVIIIDSVEIENEGNFAKGTIKFRPNPAITESEREKIFDSVETDKGKIIDRFTFIDDNTAQVTIPADGKISMIILKSPHYEYCIRKVSIEE